MSTAIPQKESSLTENVTEIPEKKIQSKRHPCRDFNPFPFGHLGIYHLG